MRRALVLVPYDQGGLWTAEFGGIRWVCGFTDEAAPARFAEERAVVEGAEDASRSWEYAAVRGARLLDELIPALGVPTGVAVNVADPDGSMLFPPVVGIVPDAVAVDADVDVPSGQHPGRTGHRPPRSATPSGDPALGSSGAHSCRPDRTAHRCGRPE
ncbi:hypothetical protein ACH489_27860 [Streptomyces rubiginosohelvolus]|uniref:hypothetical protein n=1 Tax=Streptomyces TaxID=1883 RepID=UPI0035E36A60